jgi:hypothetical protein
MIKYLSKTLMLNLCCLMLLACTISSCKGKQKFSELDSAGKDYHGIPQSASLAIPPDYNLPPPKN